VGDVLTPVAAFVGDGDDGAPGAEPPPDDTTAESNVDVLIVDVSWLVTSIPAATADGNEIVVEPTCVHVEPSADTDPVTVVPLRVSFSHTGAAWTAPANQLVLPPLVERVMNSMSPVGRRSSTTCCEPAATDVRSMMPAFANELVFCTPTTRATMEPSPVNV